MFELIKEIGQGGAAVLLGLATGAGWVAAIIAPNCFYDGLDSGRADRQVRNLLKAVSAPTALLLCGAAALGFLGGAIGAAICAGLAAFGFFANAWTLAPTKKGEKPKGVRQRHKTKRIVAVGLTLMFTAVAAIGSVLAVFGV